MSTDGQGTKWRTNIVENFNRLSRAHEHYRQTVTDRQMTDRQTECCGRQHIANPKNQEVTNSNTSIKLQATRTHQEMR